jgi:hypothetical protein
LGASKTISDPRVRLAQTVHLSSVNISTIYKWTEPSFHLSFVSKEFDDVHPKRFSKPMVCSAQTMHLSCTNTNTVSKQTERRFHMIHVT